MAEAKPEIPVVIVGGGPVGLFLAISLIKKGVKCRVLERRKDPVPDSRSLGIHPVSLELFDELGITQPFLKAGLKIRKGIAFTENKKLGEISFENSPQPHNYILACPQFTTESILRKELHKLDSDALIQKADFQGFEEKDQHVLVNYHQTGDTQQIRCGYLVGCDGKNSQVRREASIHYSGKRYPDTYIMGDFEDTTNFGQDAAVFLPRAGLIECFPLPNGMRRWVVKTDHYIKEPNKELLSSAIKTRIGYDISMAKNTMLSSFGVQHFTAEVFAKGRILLAGDAAHVVSPIGGQGMNLGWLGAWKLSKILSEETPSEAPDAYSKNHKKIVAKVARRAEMNMMLGRASKIPAFKNLFLKFLLRTPLKKKIARLFTMRDLDSFGF